MPAGSKMTLTIGMSAESPSAEAGRTVGIGVGGMAVGVPVPTTRPDSATIKIAPQREKPGSDLEPWFPVESSAPAREPALTAVLDRLIEELRALA